MTEKAKCPYCGSSDLFWGQVIDSVSWGDTDAGVIYSRGVRCKNKECKGAEGFTVEFGFTTGGISYCDNEWNEIEEVSE